MGKGTDAIKNEYEYGGFSRIGVMVVVITKYVAHDQHVNEAMFSDHAARRRNNPAAFTLEIRVLWWLH